MALEFVENGTTQGKSSGGGKGIYIDSATIVNADIQYGQIPKGSKYSDDIGITLTLDIGKAFQPELYIGGSYRTDDNDMVISWGTAYRINTLFKAAGLKLGDPLWNVTPLATASLPNNASDNLKGKEIVRLRYRSTRTNAEGKAYTNDFKEVYNKGSEDFILKRFNDSVQKGYIKDYDDGSDRAGIANGPPQNEYTDIPA